MPYDSPWPADPARRAWARAARVAGYVVILGAILTAVIQSGVITARNLREAAAFDAQYGGLTRRQQAQMGLDRPKSHAGAIARWATAVREFWKGGNVYRTHEEVDADDIALHPNMPFVVILLTPFACLPPVAMAWTLSALKVAVLLAAAWAMVRVASHRGLRMQDWVVFLGMLYAILPIVGDVRHGNTNVFVLGAIALHLWLHRRGRDLWAGASLALAVCLKMTPALFGLYWLYQRNWRLLVGLVAAMVLFAAVIPAAAVGPERYQELMGDWMKNLIAPGLVKGDWYPIHTNQSLPGTVGRYVLGGPGGNILWGPDDHTYEEQKRLGQKWINVVDLPEPAARMLVRALQAAIVLLMAWAIGWRVLPRDDGRRALHYGLVVLGMLILNQRTWDHHAAILPVATLPVWYAVAFGRFGARARWAGLLLVLVAGPLLLVPGVAELLARLRGAGSAQANLAGDLAAAYGPALAYFLLMLAATILLSRALRESQDPYSLQRQRLGAGGALGAE